MVAKYSILHIAAIVCTLGFWVGFFLLFMEASREGRVDMGRAITIAVGAVVLYVVSVLIKRHLKKHGL